MNRFQCPRCKGALCAATPAQVACGACGTGFDATNGILDLASSDAAPREAGHKPAEEVAWLDRIALAAGERWPETLGTVLQIGCGGGLSSALIASGQTHELAIIDPSIASLNDDRTAVERAGLIDRVPVSFAACPPGASLRDVGFDTCISLTALEQSDNPRRLLAELFRCLKPGGRAILVASNQRYHRALGGTLADILALQIADNPAPDPDRDGLLGQLALMRLADLQQGAVRAALIDADAVRETALQQGFDTAAVLPLDPDPDGSAAAAALLQQQGAGPGYAAATLALLPGFRRRYFDLLHPSDRSSAALLWLTKPVGPRLRTFRALPQARPLSVAPGHEMASLAGGLPVRCWLDLLARRSPNGLTLTIVGWCLASVDILAARVIIDGSAGEAAVWCDRSDVQQTLNGAGLYPAWNALCSGVDATLYYAGLCPEGDHPTLSVQLLISNGSIAELPCTGRIPLGESVRVVA
jgi:SAM-dependent methyltransferase